MTFSWSKLHLVSNSKFCAIAWRTKFYKHLCICDLAGQKHHLQLVFPKGPCQGSVPRIIVRWEGPVQMLHIFPVEEFHLLKWGSDPFASEWTPVPTLSQPPPSIAWAANVWLVLLHIYLIPDIFLKLNNIRGWCDPDVKGQLKSKIWLFKIFVFPVWHIYLSGTTLVWTPPFIMVRLTVVTSPSVLLESAWSLVFSWALCSRKASKSFQFTRF